MSVQTQEGTVARLFVALVIPEDAQASLKHILTSFNQDIQATIPPDRWHLTLHFLGVVPGYQNYLKDVGAELPQAYAPTVTITHVGCGLRQNQLWAYVHRTTVLQTLRSQLDEHLAVAGLTLPDKASGQEFRPHVKLAQLQKRSSKVGLADVPATITFSACQVGIWRSELTPTGPQYTAERMINLTP